MNNGVVDTIIAELDDNFDRLKEALLERKQLGVERYGKALSFGMDEVGKQYLMEEILDAIVYSRHLGYLEVCTNLCFMYNGLLRRN
jgi:hypothetical protein